MTSTPGVSRKPRKAACPAKPRPTTPTRRGSVEEGEAAAPAEVAAVSFVLIADQCRDGVPLIYPPLSALLMAASGNLRSTFSQVDRAREEASGTREDGPTGRRQADVTTATDRRLARLYRS